ncbi:PAS domain S-box protein [Okeanomitos corallinicola TIOX110]|uniref:histidine kinase n=1 Tax=Okeanomitos corallinicola TIOX110 TaxID=3133117 RepID=A0ABZ2UMQ4_9CYAN
MQASSDYFSIKNLESIIDDSPLTIAPETPVLDAIAMMAKYAKGILITSDSQLLGYLTQQDIVDLVASARNLNNTTTTEVMRTPVMQIQLQAENFLVKVTSLLHESQFKLFAVVDEQGKLQGTITPESLCLAIAPLAQTITDCQVKENQLRQSQQMLQLIMDTVPHYIFWKDINSRFLSCNRKFAQMVGYENSADIVGKTDDDLIANPEIAEFYRAYDDAVMQNNQPECNRITHQIQADGSQMWLETNKVPLLNTQGQVIGMLGTMEDITERVRSQTALEKSDQKYQQITQLSPVGIFRCDSQGNYLYVNNRWHEITGLTPSSAMGLGWLEAVYPEDREGIIQEFLASVLENRPFRSEYRLLCVDGTATWVLGQAVAELMTEEKVITYLGTFTDITDYKQVELALAEKVKLADLRTKIDAILTQSENLIAMMRGCTDILVEHLEVSFARLWTLNPETQILELQVSSGIYIHINGCHSHIAVGRLKIGLIAAQGQPHCTNSLENDPYINNKEWAKREGMKSFAGYPLIVEGEIIGVIAMFSQKTMTAEAFTALGIVANEIAIGIKRKQTESALRESEERFRNLVETSSDCIWEIDVNGTYTYVSPNIKEILGYQQQELLGKTAFDLMPPAEAERFNKILKAIFTDRKPFKYLEKINLHKDGHLVVLETSGVPRLNSEGEFWGYRGIARDITERKSVEKSLLRLQKAIESTSDAISITDITGQAIYVNPAFIEIFDYTESQLNNCGGMEANFRNKQLFKIIFNTVQKGQSWRGEVAMKTRNGEDVQIDLRTDAITDSRGNIVSFVSIYTDITQRKIIEEGLRLRDRAMAATRNGVVIADVTTPGNPIIYVNSGFENITGYTAAEALGQDFPLFQDIEINQQALLRLKTAMETGKDCTVILHNYSQHSNLLWHELNISPVYDVYGSLTHYIGIQTDITEHKQTEIELLISQQRLQYLLTASPAVIYTRKTKDDFGAIFISNNIESMVGYEAQEFLTYSEFWHSHIHPDDAPSVMRELSQVLEKNEYSLEYRFLHQDGRYRWVYDQGKVVWDEFGNPLELVGYWADITNRKQLEQELIIALEKEKELNELKSRFISMTSHEFRTPLSTILSSAELLEHYRYKWSEDKQLTHLHRIETAVHRMTEMLDDILVSGKAEAGKLEYRPISLDLVQYCHQLVEEVKLNVKNQHFISFSSEDKSICCYMDDKLLGHIFTNLLSNAIKYSADNTLVKFTLVCHDKQAIFEIEDQGIGIPEEDLPHLFESFYRARNVGNILGTGLGLAIVKKCVDIYQGEIYVTSNLGLGTKFTVKIPLKKNEL